MSSWNTVFHCWIRYISQESYILLAVFIRLIQGQRFCYFIRYTFCCIHSPPAQRKLALLGNISSRRNHIIIPVLIRRFNMQHFLSFPMMKCCKWELTIMSGNMFVPCQLIMERFGPLTLHRKKSGWSSAVKFSLGFLATKASLHNY